jgi:hypothetical protein
MRLLEADGYACTRAAASLGAFDVVGIGPADVVVVQCKTNAWPSAPEMDRLARFPAPTNVRKLVHRWRDGQRRPDVRELGSTLAHGQPGR